MNRKNIEFININSHKYVSASCFTLISHEDSYQILMNNKLPRWNIKFRSVQAAESYLNTHNYIAATLDSMPMSSDDIEFIISMYGFDNSGYNMWSACSDSSELDLKIDDSGEGLTIYEKPTKHLQYSKKHHFTDAIDAIDYLDSIFCVSAIKCASAKEMASKLVRVKSSNLWAYAIDIRDRHDKTGTVYIQFKGKNGGPGDTYCYYDVPINIWRKLIASPSKGHAFWVLIRNNYRYSKLTGDKKGKFKNAVN